MVNRQLKTARLIRLREIILLRKIHLLVHWKNKNTAKNNAVFNSLKKRD